jgi:hypothetical protein
MSIIAAPNTSGSQLLPRDFAQLLSELPSDFEFNLYYLQGALRFTREGIPNHQSYERELKTAQQLGLIEPAGEDVSWSEDEWQRGYPRELHAGQQFKRTTLKIDLRSHTRVAPNERKQPIIFEVGGRRSRKDAASSAVQLS